MIRGYFLQVSNEFNELNLYLSSLLLVTCVIFDFNGINLLYHYNNIIHHNLICLLVL